MLRLPPLGLIHALLPNYTQTLMTGDSSATPLLDNAGPVCAMRPRGAKTDAMPDRQSVAASIATLILTLPALCGSKAHA